MHLITRNINTGFRKFVQYFYHGVVVRESYSNPNGSGTVLRIPEPVLITFTHPRERVLFNEVRDINPFFALYETLWMLSGRNDVGPLSYYNSKIKDFSDDGKTLNGAYGYRWRHAKYQEPEHYGKRFADQLNIIIDHLRTEPYSRRAILQMWNVEDDLCNLKSKDVCCNLDVMFEIRDDPTTLQDDAGPIKHLDMTVTNRSNDLLWGTFGNDFVVFSFLQEYMAARLGVEVGVYHHFSNNLHVYDKRKDWKPVELLMANIDATNSYKMVPFISDPVKFGREAAECVEVHENGNYKYIPRTWTEPFIQDVAHPAFQALHFHKSGDHNKADGWLRCIKADDWRLVCTQWISRRTKQEKEHVS